METLGEKIKRIRKSKGLSQEQVAQACGIKQPSYSNIEKNITGDISLTTAKGIASALGVSFNYLFDIESEIEAVKANYENNIALLESKIKDKDLLINALLSEKKVYKNSVINSVNKVFNPMIFDAIELVKKSVTDEEKENNENNLTFLEKVKENYIDNLMSFGFIDESELKTFFKNVQEIYEKVGGLDGLLQRNMTEIKMTDTSNNPIGTSVYINPDLWNF